MILSLVAGIITGFIVSIPPLGPIAFALISKGFRNEVKEGMSIAAGSAFMDMIYALIAFGGISLFISLLPVTIEELINGNSGLIQIILTYAGCVVVVIYGIKIMRSKLDLEKFEERETHHLEQAENRAKGFASKSHVNKVVKSDSNLMGQFLMGVMLCISSITLPASWVILVGYVKGFGVLDNSFFGGLLFSVGAFSGTILWFWLLLKLITGNAHRINKNTVGKLNFYAGIVLIVLGIFLFFKATGSVFNIL